MPWVYLKGITALRDECGKGLGCRGKLPSPVLVADAYFGGWSQGYHMGGYNALFYDLHARWIRDPEGRIRAAKLPDPNYGYTSITSGKAKAFQVWEYFSQTP